MGENLHWEYDDFEFDNRVTNLMWTICGDYKEQMSTAEKTNLSKNIALYYGITAGGRRRFIDWQLVDTYVGWRRRQGFKRDRLQLLILYAANPMVIDRLVRERPGIADIQNEACSEMVALMEMPDSNKILDQVEFAIFETLAGAASSVRPEAQQLAEGLLSLRSSATTAELLEGVDAIYIEWQGLKDTRVLDWGAILHQDKEKDINTEDFVDSVISAMMGRESLQVNSDQKEMSGNIAEADVVYLDQEQIDNMHKQVAHYCGSSYLESYQVKQLQSRICKGVHRDCRLHYTEGVLRSECDGEFQRKYAKRDLKRNQDAYQANLRVYSRTIKRLRDALIRTLVAERARYPVASDSGDIDAAKVWRVGRTPCSRIFRRFESNDKGGYVVDLLLDSSTSQKGREALVAIQAYIIARALIEAGIPCRVNGFNCFLDFTVLKRFRNYDDPLRETENIFEYYCEGSNRDGLAIKGICDGLYTRDEENKILIILSDGKPNDMHLERKGNKNPFRGEKAYTGGLAVGDTAKEVRIARQRGISVLGVFTGNEQELKAEKLIYGKDFIYTRDVKHFADIVTTYLKRIITR